MISANSPRIVGKNRADFTDIESFLKFEKFKNKKNEELILAIYDYLTSTVDGSYHWWDMEEDKGDPSVKGRVIDSVKLFNVYGWLICGQMAYSLCRIYTSAGFKARMFGAPGHTISEVYYENSWHFLDVDMWTWFKNKNNTIASAYELSQNANELILENKNKSNPCNLPDRSLKGYAEMFNELATADGDIDTVGPDFFIQAHTMDFHLRPGESMSRSVKALGRFHLPTRFLPMIKRNGGNNEWKGHPSERYAPFRTYGNGQWKYEPQLSNNYLDFEIGVWEKMGVTQNDRGLIGNGYAIFRILSPYVFCGISKIDNNTISSSNGVFINLKGKGAISLEINNSENEWVKIKSWETEFEETLDVTEIFDGRYHALIKIIQKDKSVLEKFGFEGYIQTAPMAIPRLSKGQNDFTVLSQDKLGLNTIPYHMPIDFRENKGLEKRMLTCKNGEVKIERPGWLGIFPVDTTKPVQVEFKFQMPTNKKMAWCYVYAIIKETKYKSAKGFAKIEYSEDGSAWQVLSSREISQTKLHWDCSLDGQVKFNNPISEIFFRITSDTNISGFHCYGHLEAKPHQGELKIKHHWKEGEESKSFDAPAGKNSYSFICEKDASEHEIALRVDSLKK